MTIVEFLNERLAEREAAALRVKASKSEPVVCIYGKQTGYSRHALKRVSPPDTEAEMHLIDHLTLNEPDRVLREVKAHRAILADYMEHADYDTDDWEYEGATGRIHGIGEAIRHLAAAHADHRDYNSAWRPE